MISLDDRLDIYQSLDFIDPCPYRGPMTTMTVTSTGTFHPGPDTLDELAWAIDGDGIGFHEAAIASVVTWARALGFDPSSSTCWRTLRSRRRPGSGPSGR